MTIPVIDAIKSLNPSAWVGVSSNDINKIHWHDGNPTEITTEQIIARQEVLQVAYDAQEYARKRQAEYPSIAELTVALYDTDDKSAVEAKRAAVKAKYPKP